MMPFIVFIRIATSNIIEHIELFICYYIRVIAIRYAIYFICLLLFVNNKNYLFCIVKLL